MPQAFFFEDITAGDHWYAGPYHAEKQEMMELALKWDPLPYHVDEAAAVAQFGGLTAPGLYVMAVRINLVWQLPRIHVIASFGYDEVRFLEPVRPGDALSLDFEFAETRPSKSKNDRGIVKLRNTLLNQKQQPVLTLYDTVLVWGRNSELAAQLA